MGRADRERRARGVEERRQGLGRRVAIQPGIVHNTLAWPWPLNNAHGVRRSVPLPPEVGGEVKRIILILVLLAAAGCGGAIPRMHYYVLDIPAPAPQKRAPANYAVTIMPFRAPDQLEQDRIVYRPSAVEVDFYDYHRWAQRPASVLTHALAERFRDQNLFASVAIFDGRTKADYIIRPRLEHLEEVDSPGNVSVRVEIFADVVELKTSRTVWSGSATHTGRVEQGEVKAVVAEMSRGVDDCLGQITAGVENFAKSLPPAPVPSSAASP